MSPFAASLRREWRLLRSRPRDWAMVSWVPLLAMALMCWIFSAGQPQRLPIAVWNEDGASPLSRQLVRMLEATPGLQVRQAVLNRLEAADALQRMQVHGVVHIPPGFARDVQRGAGASVTLLHNAQLATHSSLLQRDLRQVVGTLSAGVEMQALAKRGTPAQLLQLRVEPIRTQLVALFNVSTNYEQFLATTLVPALVHILAMTAGAWSVGRELRDRTLGQWLAGGGTGVGAGAVLAALLGKLLVPLTLLWASALACLLYLSQLRGWAVAGSMAWIALGLALLVAVSLAAGAALAGLTLSLRTAMSGAGLLSAPAFAFSGVGFPLLAMSGSARTWAEAMPYTHYARLQIEQWQMGAPPAQSLPVVAGLLLATLALLALATAGLLRGLRRPERWGAR
ncbi:ABC transporter permease [Pulveribacter sp.]|uniref:ABC transporter permease n=1 Tax=Pulveribacter sp. TaxID=2678893 RepID=UPI0028996F30|nr:ABC transporter permease [Pulveribacter sp.]